MHEKVSKCLACTVFFPFVTIFSLFSSSKQSAHELVTGDATQYLMATYLKFCNNHLLRASKP